MTRLYTLLGCPNCDAAKVVLNETNEAFIEVSLEDPITNLGARTLVGKALAPFILRDDGQFYWLVMFGEEKKFVKLLV